QVSKTGRVTPLAEGTATITVKVRTPHPGGPLTPTLSPSEAERETASHVSDVTATLAITVEQFKDVPTVNFPNQIVPIFTKAGCNAGGCHGKSSGQNGFKLSLLGFEQAEDYEHLTMEARGRRIFAAAPDRSLLLQKATATLPYGGGKRLDIDADDYKLLLHWIAKG